MKIRPRSQTKLPTYLKDRLDRYATAATAAGVGLFTLSTSAAAEVVFTPTHVLIATNQSYNLDVNNDGIVDFTIFDTSSGIIDRKVEVLGVLTHNLNRVFGYTSTSGPCGVPALQQGKTIGPEQPFCRSGPRYYLAIAQRTGSQYRSAGYWPNVNNRYLGVLFKANGQRHFGWVRLSVRIDKASITTRLTGYAYESVPNKPIEAGQRLGSTPDQDAPQSQDSDALVTGSLGMLALGAQGIPASRP